MATHVFLEGLVPTLHIAHRGGSALAPENTLAAFRSALERWRTDMLELDVHLSADGELIVSHDPTVDRCTDGSGAVAQMTVPQLRRLDAGYRFLIDENAHPFRGRGERLPLLREVLEAFPTTRLNIELKAGGANAVSTFARLIRETRAASRVCCGAESDDLGLALAEALPEACHFYPRNALLGFVLSVKHGEPAPTGGPFTVLDMPLFHEGMRLVDPELLDAARGAGKWINVWTIDDEAEMRRLKSESVGGVMTDRPDLLRTVLDGG